MNAVSHQTSIRPHRPASSPWIRRSWRTAFRPPSLTVRRRGPARKYVFLSTKTLIDGLFEAALVAVAAIQTHSRRGSDPAYARHMLRFQHPRESVTLVDAIPQIVAHPTRTTPAPHTKCARACTGPYARTA